MQSEEEKTDLACLQAIQDMGGYVTLESWLYSLYLRDTVLTSEEFNAIFCRLVKNKLISDSLLGYRLTSRGGAVLRGDCVSTKKRKKDAKPFSEKEFEENKARALHKWKMKQDGNLKSQTWAGFFGVVLWLFSVACLAGGIVFACLYNGTVGWRIGVGITGVVLYLVLGTIAGLVCAQRCSYRMQKFLSIVCFPSYGLLSLILLLLAYGG